MLVAPILPDPASRKLPSFRNLENITPKRIDPNKYEIK